MFRSRFPPAVVCVALLCAACGADPLAFVPRHIPIRHDGHEVFDAALLDLDNDGDQDIVAGSAAGLHYLTFMGGGWGDETLGTALNTIPGPIHRLHRLDNNDLIYEWEDRLTALKYSGIGSWSRSEAPVAPGEIPEGDPLVVEADLDGDGRIDRARLEGRSVKIELRDPHGALRDVSSRVGANAVRLRADGRRLLAGDLDGDGDTDLLAVGGRLFALLNNGGAHTWMKEASARTDEVPTGQADSTDEAWFLDGTRAAQLEFAHREGNDQWDIRPTMGPGAAWADVDGDGDDDLYVVGGRDQRGRLYLNDGRGRFVEATQEWSLMTTGSGMGASFADYDNDGDPDLYVTRQGPNMLLRNDNKRFVNVTDWSGTGDPRWGASSTWADFDRDGDLDLFVTNYLKYDPTLLPRAGGDMKREDPLAMLPYVFPGQVNVLYRNDGRDHFTDVTLPAGLANLAGKSLGAIVLDENEDGWPDLYVANDTTPNTLWLNRGVVDDVPRFEDVALFVGLDDPRGGMGLAMADLDGDADEELLVTYWQTEPNGLYRHNARHLPTERRFVPRFEDVTVKAGLAAPSVGVVGWGCVLADLDNDGDEDLFVANGYTSPDYETTMTCVGQPDHLFDNVTPPDGLESHADVPRFEQVSADRAGPPFEQAWASRGAAAADPDGDGDLDIVVTSNNGPLVLLRNQRGGRSLRVVPEGARPKCNRDAVGARVTLHLDDDSTRTATVRAGASYLSAHERGVRFGLGSRRARSVDVAWPDGTSSSHEVPPDGTVRVVQPTE